MISKSGVHAVRAAVALAQVSNGTFVGAAQLAAQIEAPPNYLGKLLQTLAGAGLLESQKGMGGGFRLARPPHEVSLYDIVEPIDRVSRWSGCFLGGASCGNGDPCPVHARWGPVRDAYLQFLRETTVAQLRDRAT